MSLRTKLFLVLGGLFAGVAAMTAFAALRFRAIGYEIERILQENYRSVIAALPSTGEPRSAVLAESRIAPFSRHIEVTIVSPG